MCPQCEWNDREMANLIDLQTQPPSLLQSSVTATMKVSNFHLVFAAWDESVIPRVYLRSQIAHSFYGQH